VKEPNNRQTLRIIQFCALSSRSRTLPPHFTGTTPNQRGRISRTVKRGLRIQEAVTQSLDVLTFIFRLLIVLNDVRDF
jgi:hypothetical protein